MVIFLVSTAGIVFPNYSQEHEEDLDALLQEILGYDSLMLDEMQSDSTSILTLLDSLINSDFKYSSLSIRAGYISDILNAGRDFGINQYGLTAGVSYYHKSGLFGDMNTYWNSDAEPRLNPLTTSLGYMGTAGKWFNYFLTYDHYFYSEPDDPEVELHYPITNALNGAAYANSKYVTAGLDYSFLFGEESAHRIRGSLYAPINITKLPVLDKISILPTVSVLAGNLNIYTISTNYQLLNSLTDLYNRTGKRKFGTIYEQYQDQIFEQIYKEEVDNVFGIMNYGISLPIYMYIDNFSFSLAYTQNFPQALPGETITYEPNGYFSLALIYSIPFHNK